MSRFGFLKDGFPELYALCFQAENATDSDTTMLKCRQALEWMVNSLGAHNHNLFTDINDLSNKGILNSNISHLFHSLRLISNKSIHKSNYKNSSLNQAKIKNCINQLIELTVWFVAQKGKKYTLADFSTEDEETARKYINFKEIWHGASIDPLRVNKQFSLPDDKVQDTFDKDIFETQEEYEQRIMALEPIHIGYGILDTKRTDGYTNNIFLKHHIDKNNRVKIPDIDALFVDNVMENDVIDDELVAKLKVYQGKIWVDDEKIFLRNGENLISLKVIAWNKFCYESDKEHQYRIEQLPLIPFCVGYPIRNKYNLKDELLPFVVNPFKYTEKVFDFIFPKEKELVVPCERTLAKKLCQSHKELSLFGKIKPDYKWKFYTLWNPNTGIVYQYTSQECQKSLIGRKDTFLKKSKVRLLKQRVNRNIPEILILTSDLDMQWNTFASDIVIAGNINASSYIKQKKIFNHTNLAGINLKEYNAEFHMANEFFTDKIAVFYRAYNTMPNVLNNKVYQFGDAKVNIILPVKKCLLDYLEPNWLAEHTEIEVVDQDIIVTMDLPVSNEDHPLIQVSKTYHATQNLIDLNSEKEIAEYDTLPLIQIWPNIKLREPNKWNAYYTYFDSGYDVITDFHATPIYEGEGESICLPDTTAEITRSSNFPEAFVCEQIEQRSLGEEKCSEIGLLLLNTNKLEEVNTRNLECKIGIDVDKDYTIAYMKINGDQPQLIQFENHKYTVTFTRDAESITIEDEGAVRQNFIPEENKKAIIKNMYHNNPQYTTAKPFFSGNIYYINLLEEDISILKKIKTTEMKWNHGAGIISMQGFLMQLCMQCLLEAVIAGADRVEWMFSYPKSFSLYQLYQYQSMWTISIFEIIKGTSTIKNFVPDSLSENESVMEYFKNNMRVSIKRGILCLDIGGDFSDIAIWQDRGINQNSLINQTSLRSAGHNLFNEYIWNRKKSGYSTFLRLKNNDAQFTKLLNDLYEVDDKEVFDILLNALFYDYQDDFSQLFSANSMKPEVRKMLRDVTFAISGLFFYCGMLIGYLRKNDTYCNRKGELLPNCYVAGNISRFLQWNVVDIFSSSSWIVKVFKQSLFTGFSLKNPNEKMGSNFTINFTDRPGQEAAYGLVASEKQKDIFSFGDIFNFDDDKEEKQSLLLAGEKFNINNEESNHQIITAKEFLSNISIDYQKIDNFTCFVDIFNRMMRYLNFDTVKFTKRDFAMICMRVNQHLKDKKKAASGNADLVEPVPLFIMILKEAYLYLSMH